MKNLILITLALSLGGCFAGVETKSGWHMVSLPPSSGRRLSAQCSKEKLRDLEMENAALRAANEELLKDYSAFK